MILRYLLISVLVTASASSLIVIYKHIDNKYQLERFTESNRLIGMCRLQADEILSKEWENNCKLHSLDQDCNSPINFLNTIKEDRIRQYKICTETYK